MEYRYFRRISTGERTNVIFKSEAISGDTDSQRADIGGGLGWALEDTEAVTVLVDPGPGNVAQPVPVVVAQPDPDVELTRAIEAATDFASLKAALLGNKSRGMVKGRPV